MTTDKRERLNWLCKQIQEEQDQKKFNELVSELNKLLESNEHRLGSQEQERRPS